VGCPNAVAQEHIALFEKLPEALIQALRMDDFGPR